MDEERPWPSGITFLWFVGAHELCLAGNGRFCLQFFRSYALLKKTLPADDTFGSKLHNCLCIYAGNDWEFALLKQSSLSKARWSLNPHKMKGVNFAS